MNGFIVSFTSGFDHLKKRKRHPCKLSITIDKVYIPLLSFIVSVYLGGPTDGGIYFLSSN